MEAETPKSNDPAYRLILTGEGVSIDRNLDAETALAVVELVIGGGNLEPKSQSRSKAKKKAQKRKSPSSGDGKARTPRRPRTSSPKIVRDLSLRPKGKQSFMEFADEKQPRNHPEKQAVTVYWLTKTLEMQDGITLDHVNTCYVGAKWKRPANFENNLQVTATRKGWIDTSDGSNIRITVPGEDLVVHDLPVKSD
jgi:hypothetical protein